MQYLSLKKDSKKLLISDSSKCSTRIPTIFISKRVFGLFSSESISYKVAVCSKSLKKIFIIFSSFVGHGMINSKMVFTTSSSTIFSCLISFLSFLLKRSSNSSNSSSLILVNSSFISNSWIYLLTFGVVLFVRFDPQMSFDFCLFDVVLGGDKFAV